jgi:hypothetical protein
MGGAGNGSSSTGGGGNQSKRKYSDLGEVGETTMAAALEKEHEEVTRVKNIRCIELGPYEIETWYFSPYPGERAILTIQELPRASRYCIVLYLLP